MSKTVQKPPLPRRDASGAPVGLLSVPKTGKSIGTLPFLDRSAGRSSHGNCYEVPVGKIAVPKTVQKSRSLRRDATDVLLLVVAAPKEGR